MKIFLISLFSLLIIIPFQNLQSQDENFLGICVGTALPQGSYASKDYSNEQAGYANPGFLFSFDAAWFPDDYLGVGATITYGSNNPDKQKYKQDLLDDVAQRYPNLETDSIYVDYGTWRYLNFHLGPHITIPAGNFNFDLRALAGLSLAWAPEQYIQINFTQDEVFSRKNISKAIPTIGYTLGAGVRYAFGSGFVIRGIAEFTNCKPTIETTEEVTLSEDEGIQTTTKDVAFPIKNIHLGIGIAYNFEL